MTTTRRETESARRHGSAWAVDPRRSTTALFALVVIVMGTGFVATRAGVASAPPLFLAAVRFYLTAVVLLVVTVSTGRPWRPHTADDWAAVAVVGLLLFAGAIGLLFVGQQYTTAGVAATVMCLGPVLTTVVARVVLPSDRLSRSQAAGVVVGLLGAVVVAAPGPSLELGAGVPLVFGAAATGSLGGVLLGRVRTSVPLTTQAAWGALLGGLVLHAGSRSVGEPAGAVVWTPALAGVVLYLAVAVGGVGYLAYLSLLRTVGPTRTSVTAYLSPVVAALIGWLTLHEPLTVGLVVGFASIVSGFVLVNGGERGHA